MTAVGTRTAIRCDRCEGDPSALRLIVTERTWYLLDVTEDGVYADQPEPDGQPLLHLVCLDCGHQADVRPELRALLRLE